MWFLSSCLHSAINYNSENGALEDLSVITVTVTVHLCFYKLIVFDGTAESFRRTDSLLMEWLIVYDEKCSTSEKR